MTDLGKPIAVGRTAELYAWENGQVLKLFHNWFEIDDIRFEQRMNRAVHASGLPVPAPGEIIQVEGRNGLLYERVDGPNLWDMLNRYPWRVVHYARQTAELHVKMHTANIQPDIPSLRERLERKIHAANQLPDPVKQAALATLASLPAGERLCHGDFHPGNILLTPRRAVIIDWIDASRGSPLADVARTSVIALGAAASPRVRNRALGTFINLFHTTYLRHYFRLKPGGEAEYRRWLPVVAAARLSENIPELESWLIAQASRSLQP